MKRPIVLLSVLVVLLIGAAGLTIYLYLGMRDQTEEQARSVEEITKTIDENKRTQADYRSKNDTVVASISTLETGNAWLHTCADAAKELIFAAKGDDKERLTAAVQNTEAKC